VAVVPEPGQVIKANSYFHDESGITIEDDATTRRMQEKLLAKEASLAEGLHAYEQVKVHGDRAAGTALLCWGSNAGVCREVAEILGIRSVRPIVLWPFPREQLSEALAGADRIIAVENNATGQFVALCRQHGIATHGAIRKYDGRPFSVDELTAKAKEAIA
jgi:2-oxoglutarate ferredoxin oxidoreductase subunit alpha